MYRWEKDIKCIEMARRSVNQLVFAFLCDRRMPTIRHFAIIHCVPGQYCREGFPTLISRGVSCQIVSTGQIVSPSANRLL